MVSGVTPHVWHGPQCHSVNVLVPSKDKQTSSISAGRLQWGHGQGRGADMGEGCCPAGVTDRCKDSCSARLASNALAMSRYLPIPISPS